VKNLDSDVMTATVLRVLEEAAFVFAESVEETEAPDFADSIVVTDLSFAGPGTDTARGRLILAANTDWTQELAANMMGTDPDDPDIQGKGPSSLGELLNMIGGVLMGDIFGPVATSLGIPRIRTLDASEFASLSREDSSRVILATDEGHRIELLSVLEEGL